MQVTHPYCAVGLERAASANVVTVTGEVDLFAAPTLAEMLDRAGTSEDPVVVDLGPCTFLDSNGLYALLKAHQAAERAGRPLLVARTPDGCADRFLSITVPDQFTAHPSREAALGALA